MDDGERYLFYKGIASKMVRVYLGKYGLTQDAEGLAHDIAADMVALEMSGKTVVKINASAVIYNRIRNAVHSRYNQRRDKTMTRLLPCHDLIQGKPEKVAEILTDPLDDIMASPAGKLVVLCLWRRRRGRLADVVRRIAEIAGEKWTRENIAAIVTVKKTLGRKK